MRAHAHDLRVEVEEVELAATLRAADLDALRGHGWSDRELHDACQVVAYFNYVNRLADGLGVDPEPDLPWTR